MNAVGIDVSKEKSMMAALRPMEKSLSSQGNTRTIKLAWSGWRWIFLRWLEIPAWPWRLPEDSINRQRKLCTSMD